MKLRAFIAFIWLRPALACAYTLPDTSQEPLNDLAAVIAEPDKTELHRLMNKAAAELNIWVAVVTVKKLSELGNANTSSLHARRQMARLGLMYHNRDDSILLLVASEDRQVRLEIGTGYAQGYDRIAQQIVDEVILPAFRSGDLSDGILQGVATAITDIARPHHNGVVPEQDSSENLKIWFAIIVVIGITVAIKFRDFSNHFLSRFTRFRRCSPCNEKALTRTRKHLHDPIGPSPGAYKVTYTCRHCDHVDSEIALFGGTIPNGRSNRSGGFLQGGGSSGGGSSGGGRGGGGSW